MKPCKRIEIVVEQALRRRLEQTLIELNVSGYTLLSRASGRGDRGARRADEPTGVSSNCVFIVACETEPETSAIVEAVRPLLRRSGGICLVSDAAWVRH